MFKDHKRRKAKRIFNKIIFLSLVFFVSLGSLLSVYILTSLKKHQLLTPIGIKLQQNNTLVSGDQTIAIKMLLDKEGLTTSKIESASNSAVSVTLNSGEEIIFSTKKRLDEQIASLQLIIRQLTIEGRKYSRIDFRYDNPVVVF